MFKTYFKYYKSKNPSPKLDDVLNFNNSEDLLQKSLVQRVQINVHHCGLQYGLRKTSDWEAYQFTSHKGLIFIKNPFTPAGQRYWIKRSLKDYSKKPNKLNLDSFNTLPDNKEWWIIAQIDKKALMSLRWATLGYHHNWDSKVYCEENKGEFPEDLKKLTEFIANVLHFKNFSAEAAIVNYYHLDSTLSGHTDHSEENLEAPLFSFSFGQSAIFMLGGKTIVEKPIAMFLQSGDIIVMSKDSRLCYHGVPKIIRTDSDIWNDDNECELKDEFTVIGDSSWTPFGSYLVNSRININVRQVLNVGQLKLTNKNTKVY